MSLKVVLPIVFIALLVLGCNQTKILLQAENYYQSEKYCEGAEKCSLAYTKLTRKGNQAKKMTKWNWIKNSC